MGKVIKFPKMKIEEKFETCEERLIQGYKELEEFYKEVNKEVWYIDENGKLGVK